MMGLTLDLTRAHTGFEICINGDAGKDRAGHVYGALVELLTTRLPSFASNGG